MTESEFAYLLKMAATVTYCETSIVRKGEKETRREWHFDLSGDVENGYDATELPETLQ